MQLTQEQITRYHHDGFIVLRASEHGAVEPVTLQKWSREVQTLPMERGKWMPYFEVTESGEKQLFRTEKFADYHGEFGSLLQRDGPISSILKQLTGDDMLLFKDKINYKLPNGNGFAAHIDAPAYEHVGDIEHTTANLAVDEANALNGCVEVVPGSHKQKVPTRAGQGGQLDAEWEANAPWMSVPLSPGDLLVFGSHLAHRSGKNRAAVPRASVYATYHCASDGEDLREKYYAHRRAAFPPDHEREPGKDYAEGVARYAFAAPFTSVEVAAAPPAQATVAAVTAV